MFYEVFVDYLLFLFQFSYAQSTDFNYLGTLILSNNQVIRFSIHFNEQNGVVNGYSLTNIGNPDETKSYISGIYSKKDKSFQLQETQILSTSSEADLSAFCFINANLYIKGKLANKRLEGGSLLACFPITTLVQTVRFCLWKKRK